MIPQEKSDAVARGLQKAFDVTAFDSIDVVTGGHTNSLVFRIVVQGSPFLLKIITRAEDPTTTTRHYTSMKLAADAGIAPRVWYTSESDRISITDFVKAAPLPAPDALFRIPALLRALHALPAFADVPDRINTSCLFLLHQGPALDGLLGRIRAAGNIPKEQTEELFAIYEQLAAVYSRRDSDMVSSHNDLFKPDNILFDGTRVLLVDWEAAFRNDRYADLAVAANLVVTSDAEEKVYLQEYFGRQPTDYERARFYLMQQLAHVFYTMAFLYLGSQGGTVDCRQRVPEFREFQRRMWAREVDLSDKGTKVLYGRSHWKQLQENIRSPRFQEALEIVSDRKTAAS